MAIELETETLRSGSVIVRPKGALGTCGWSPKAWIMAYKGKHESSKQAFLNANPKWKDLL